MPINDTTSHLGLALPHPSNTLEDDVLRLRSAFNGIDAKFQALDALLASDDPSLDTVQDLVNAIKASTADLIDHIGEGGAVHAEATGSVAGFMSAADKTKLDGVSLIGLLSSVVTNVASDGSTELTVSGGYTAGSIMVFMNGAKLPFADYTATNGTTITLASGALAADEFEIVRVKSAMSA